MQIAPASGGLRSCEASLPDSRKRQSQAEEGASGGPSGWGRSHPWLLTVAAALAVVAFYAATYVQHHFPVPLGWDTPGYAWRTNLARSVGVAALPRTISNPGPVNPGRAGFVTLAGLLQSLTGANSLRWAEIFPGVMAAAAGLAAGVLVTTVLGRHRWELAAVAFGVGTSFFMVHVINIEGYQDSAMAVTVFTAAATPILLSLWHRRALWPAVLLLAAAGLIHWNFFEVAAAVVLLTAVVYVPPSLRRWRVGGESLLETPAVRLFVPVAAGAVIAVASILGLLTADLPSARLVAGQFVDKLRRDLPEYHLPFTLAAAGAGAMTVAGVASEQGDQAGRARAFLALVLAWSEVTLLLFVGERALGRAIPTHRLLAYDLGLPILGMLALIWAGRQAERLWKPLLAAVLVTGLGASAYLSYGQWSSFHPVMKGDQLAQGATAAAYLSRAGVAVGRPVVFVVDDRGVYAWSVVWLTGHSLRATLPVERVEHTYFFVGTPEDYLARHPTILPAGTAPLGQIEPSRYDELTATFFGDVRGTYAHDPVALILASTNPGYRGWIDRHPDSVVAPGVAVVGGAAVGTAMPRDEPPPIGPPGAVAMAVLSLVALAVMTLAGLGWSLALIGPLVRPVEAVALAPAFGVAALVLGGLLLNRVGFGLSGGGAVAIVLIVSGAGGFLGVRARTRRA